MSDWQTQERELFAPVQQAIDRGDVRGALRALERLRARALAHRALGGLRLVVETARSLEPQARGKTLYELRRVAYAAERNAESVAGRTAIPAGAQPAVVTTLEGRIAVAERQLEALRTELADIRTLATAAAPASAPAAAPAPRPVPAPAPVARAARPAPPARPAAPPPPPPRGPGLFERGFAALGEKSAAWILAWAGGVVTALGIVLFFALAVNRGWIGPGARVAAGALASALVFSAGAYLRRRFGPTYSALAAVGAGICGAYATLLAAAALYDLVPEPAALVVAGGIAAVGLVTALAWRSELVAGLGLIGAMLAPVAVLADDHLSFLGTSFAALMLVTAGIVALRLRWDLLAIAATVASAPQIVGLVAGEDYAVGKLLALALCFAAVYIAIGAVRQLLAGAGLIPLAASLVLTGAGVAAFAAGRLFEGADRGFVLLAIGLALALPAAIAFPRARTRELSNLFAAVALTVGAVAVADLCSERTLAVAWAAEAAALAWLARRVREPRFQLASLGYAALALGYSLFVMEWPRDLFQLSAHPASSWPTLIALVVATAAIAWFVPAFGSGDVPKRGVFGLFARLFEEQLAAQNAVRVVSGAISALLSVALVSLALLELAVAVGADDAVAFDRGQVAVDVLWATLGVAAVWFGPRRADWLEAEGWIWLAVLLAKLLAYDVYRLSSPEAPVAALVVGAALLLAALARRRIEIVPVAAVAISFWLLVAGAIGLVHGDLWGADADGLALLVVALVYGVLAAVTYRGTRDFSTLLGGAAALLVAAACPVLVSGIWLVLAWGACAAVAAVLADVLSERRLLVAAYGFLLLTLGHALALDAPFDDLFTAQRHPAVGVVALLIGVAATLVVTVVCRRSAQAPTGERGISSQLADGQQFLATLGLWVGGALAGYAASLVILETAQAVSAGTVDTDFQRGHVGVSAFWGVVGLVLVYLGLVYRWRSVRLAGFAAFGVSVGKIFLYDLSNLSAMARALSFLGVGAVLLLGGFFYQRLSAELEDRHRPANAGTA